MGFAIQSKVRCISKKSDTENKSGQGFKKNLLEPQFSSIYFRSQPKHSVPYP